MALVFKMDTQQFQQALQAEKEKLTAAARPAARAGAQVIYDEARRNALMLTSQKEHYFYGRNKRRYGPFQPGNLARAIYQVYSETESRPDKPVYHVSWNYNKAPYAHMVEWGTSKAAAHSFLGKAITEKRREAMAALKKRFIEEVSKK